MAKLVWDQVSEHFYETGVSNGALAVYDSQSNWYGTPVAWNGLTAVTESPEGADANPLYADNIKYLNLRGNEEFGFTIEAYTYPDEWGECDGSATVATGVKVGQQKRKTFGFMYVTRLGNDTEGSDFSEKLHIIYGATAAPSERPYETINDSPDAITFSWECNCTPVDVSALGADLKPACIITIDKNGNDKYQAIYNMCFGTDGTGSGTGTDPKFPTPAELATVLGL